MIRRGRRRISLPLGRNSRRGRLEVVGMVEVVAMTEFPRAGSMGSGLRSAGETEGGGGGRLAVEGEMDAAVPAPP